MKIDTLDERFATVAGTSPKKHRRDGEKELVDETLFHELTEERGATLAQHPAHPVGAKAFDQ